MKYCILETSHHTFHSVITPFYLAQSYLLNIIKQRTSTIKISYSEVNGNQAQMFLFCSFSNVRIGVFILTIKWNNISFSIDRKVLWILSATVMSSIIIEAIRTIPSQFIFFYKKILSAQKSTKTQNKRFPSF